MNKTIDLTIKTDEDTEISDRFDSSDNFVAFVMCSGELIPWISFTLFHTQ